MRGDQHCGGPALHRAAHKQNAGAMHEDLPRICRERRARRTYLEARRAHNLRYKAPRWLRDDALRHLRQRPPEGYDKGVHGYGRSLRFSLVIDYGLSHVTMCRCLGNWRLHRITERGPRSLRWPRRPPGASKSLPTSGRRTEIFRESPQSPYAAPPAPNWPHLPWYTR